MGSHLLFRYNKQFIAHDFQTANPLGKALHLQAV